MITWEDFNITNKNNKKTAFENMCRILFNYYFFNNKAILKQKFDNPGIEIEPINLNGEKISFQSKYIESNNIYQQIKHSIEAAVNCYSGELDVIYIFCNKDLDQASKSYKNILSIVEPHNIRLECICNQEILSIIETNDYKTIKQLFFGKHNLSKEWFDANLKTSLEDLEPRYVSGFNVNTEIQNYFELKYMSDEMFGILANYLLEWKKSLKHIYLKDTNIESVRMKINQLSLPTKENIEEIFEWYKLFNSERDKIKVLLEECDKELTNTIDDKKRNIILEKRRDIYKVINVIEETDLSNNQLFKSLKSNVLFIEGEAGIGKSHLLGFEAEKHGNSFDRTILLLGQKLIGNNSPLEQIKEQLNTSLEINTLLDTLEGLGEVDGSNTIIMIDALNESSNNQIWKKYLNTLVNEILKYKHIKLIATIRNTYINQIFSSAIQSKIENNEIFLIEHYGFEGILDEAITKFLSYYNIPTDTIAYLGYSFVNPLFLKIYCKAYTNKIKSIGTISLSDVFNNYINEEEIKIKEKLNIDDTYPYCRIILERLANYLFNNKKTFIDIEQLYNINNSIANYDKIISAMLKSKLLVSYFIDEKEIVYFGYERILDFYIANIIINQCNSKDKFYKFLITDVLKFGEHKRFERRNAIGIFSALSILASEKFNEEIINVLNELNVENYERQQMIQDYINNLIYRDDTKINKTKLLEGLSNNINNQSLLDSFYNVLIVLSGRENNPLNALYLHEYLKQKRLNIRDAYWTVFINDNYYAGTTLYNNISYFENKEFVGNYNTKKLYVVLLTWFLTSSNRLLRDKSSRCIINLLKNDYDLMVELLDLFNDVNDPYIIQRLYGIIYGAVLKSKNNIDKLTNLSIKIYNSIFNKEIIYPDILLRDYALNILEYAKYINCKLPFEVEKCRPPYAKIKIPTIDNSVEEYFTFNGKNFTGANSIKSSLTPNIDGGYGDFGRYVFQSALSYFEGVDIKNLYLYSLKYIKDELGYTNELFSDYDRYVQSRENFSRHNTTKIERIGKKYEWIAFYRVLAIVSDNYKLSLKYDDQSSDKYKGSWNPYVRDFDPTLDLVNSNKVYDINLKLNQPIYNNWSNNKDWVNNKDDVINFKDIIFLKDNHEQDWVFLYGHLRDLSNKDYEKDYKEVWRMVSAYVIKSEEYLNFINKLKAIPLWGRWFPESGDKYNIFSREYCWSPAYKDEFTNNDFNIEIRTGEKLKKTDTRPIFEFVKNSSSVSNSSKLIVVGEETYTFDEHVKERIGNVKPLWNSYIWEEQYDASKEESIGIYLPSQEIIESLNLIQKENGIFYCEDKMVVADFSLIKGETNGLYIKKSYLNKFLKDKGYEIFWVCIGEKNDIKKSDVLTTDKDSVFKDFSSLVYKTDKKIESSDFFGDRKDHN